MIITVALDPGKTTGFAIGEIPQDSSPMVATVGEQVFSCSDLWRFLNDLAPDYIVCESFEFRQRRGTNLELYSRNLIGVVQLVSELSPYPELFMQTASYGKGHFSNDKLKEIGGWVRGKAHGRDALRHLLAWYYFGFGYQFNKEGWKLIVGDRGDQAGE